MPTLDHQLQFGPHALARQGDAAAVPYFLAGRKLYCVGHTSGAVLPFGAEHLVGEMGGIWAHPIKIADGLTIAIAGADQAPCAVQHTTCTATLAAITWQQQLADFALTRRDVAAADQPALFVLVALRNTSAKQQAGTLLLTAWLKLLGCWFGGLASGGSELWLEDGLVLGTDRLRRECWGLACGTRVAPVHYELSPYATGTRATLAYPFDLAPDQSAEWEFILTADHVCGPGGARALLARLVGSGAQQFDQREAQYQQVAFQGAALATPDPAVDRAFALAKANLLLLSADYGPTLPPYFLAGIPEYPQLFGCDTAYSVPGALAAGFADTCKSVLLVLAEYGARACGRIPHEITTNGRVFHPGNTQETPQFAVACWDYFRWTGDRAFLEAIYPLCKEGVEAYLPALWGSAGSLYPIGDGVVERPGMGSRKLDSTCYLYQALGALHAMAATLGQPAQAQAYAAQRNALRERFEHDWWLEDEALYADSLHTDLRPQLDGHWTVVLPLYVGLAGEARAQRALARIVREWVNEWGLVHTRARESEVWTLPTGLLALTALRYGQNTLGLDLLQKIAATCEYGTLGTFKELIPIGLCFVQLWSAALYIQGLVEGVLGLQPLAHLHQLTLDPRLPPHWPHAALTGLLVGAHRLSIRLAQTGLELQHYSGPAALDLHYRLPPGTAELAVAPKGAQLIDAPGGPMLVIALEAGRRLRVHVRDRQASLSIEPLGS